LTGAFRRKILLACSWTSSTLRALNEFFAENHLATGALGCAGVSSYFVAKLPVIKNESRLHGTKSIDK